MGELYEGCLRDELRTTDGDTVEAADMESVEGRIFGGGSPANVQQLRYWSLRRQLPSYGFGGCLWMEDTATFVEDCVFGYWM